MPGLVVTTGVRVGATGTTNAPASSLFIVGTAERGPVGEYRLIESMAQAEATYGGYDATGTLYQHLETFFEEGGTRAYVVRVSDGDVAASVDISDGIEAVIVSPVGPGTWANETGHTEDGPLSIEVQSGRLSNTVRIEVMYRGEVLYFSDDLASNRAVAEAINANVGTYLTATYDATVALVDPIAALTFSGGADGNVAPGLNDSSLVGGLDYFLPELGAGVVAIPEYFGTTIWDGIRDHCLANNRIGFCAFESGSSINSGIADLEAGGGNGHSYYGDTPNERTDASCLAFFWPQVVVPTGTGGTRTISPESFAAAARCRAHLQTGPWRPSAGVISASRFATGISEAVTSEDSDKANAGRINPLRVIDGSVRVYGARSISGDETNWRYITFRDTLNFIVVTAEKRLEPFIFNIIDARKTVFGDISATLVNLLEPIRAAGGIYPLNGDRGYTVEVSDALNPQAQLAAGVIAAKVGVRISSVGETINLLITKSNLTTAI